ncbi:hypothetical protein Patl1_30335 [Pistacia atlantica]|uniref:Uncharacterized protein n=1 Tax=Pistacia atlantica TaxID=434234 RepID=A0ACC1A7T6_9ROSI|nr:hypothetical protein Patl1_30335 [Pistacia atlantica]
MASHISSSPKDLHFKKFSFITKCRSKSFPTTSREDACYEPINSEAAAYTSLKDLIPSTTRSGSPKSCYSEGSFGVQCVDDISVSNLLVKKAAWAYLQPMPKLLTATSSSWRRVWDELNAPMKACINFFNRRFVLKIARAFDRAMGAINASRFD